MPCQALRAGAYDAGIARRGGVMSRFGDLEAAIMDVMWAADRPLRVREVAASCTASARWPSTPCRRCWRTCSARAG